MADAPIANNADNLSPLATLTRMLEGPSRHFSPLFVFVCIVVATDLPLAIGLFATGGILQGILVVSMVITPILVLGALVALLYSRPLNLYSPNEYVNSPSPMDFSEALNKSMGDGNRTTAVNTTSTVTATDGHHSVTLEAEISKLEGSDDVSTDSGVTNWESKLLQVSTSETDGLDDLDFVYKQYKDSEHKSEDAERMHFLYLAARLRKGDTKALSNLEQLASESIDDADLAWIAHIALGEALLSAGSHQRALSSFEIALHKNKNDVERSHAASAMGDALTRLGKSEEAVTFIRSEIVQTSDDKARGNLLVWLAAYYEDRSEHELRALALKKAVELTPGNISLHFDCARAFGAAGFDSISLIQYRTLIQISPNHANALNNLGVDYSNLNMPTLAIKNYEKSRKLGNSLAVANIAQMYLRSGFVEDAERLLEEAQADPVPDSFVAETAARIGSTLQGDRNIEEFTLNQAREQRIFLSEYGATYFGIINVSRSFEGQWLLQEDNKEIEVTIIKEDDKFKANWTKNGKVYGFILKQQFGTARISAIEGKDIEKQLWSLNDTVADQPGYAYLSDDGQMAKIMGINRGSPVFLNLSRGLSESTSINA